MISPNGFASAYEAQRHEAARRQLHAAGTQRHGEEWNTLRPLYVRAYTGNEVWSSRDLSTAAMADLARMIAAGATWEGIAADRASAARSTQLTPEPDTSGFVWDDAGNLLFATPRV